MEELKKEFSVSGISKSPSIFDNQKLDYINAEYIRQLSLEQFHEIALPWIRRTVKREDVDTRLIAKVLQARTEVLNQIPSRWILSTVCLNMIRHCMFTKDENQRGNLSGGAQSRTACAGIAGRFYRGIHPYRPV